MLMKISEYKSGTVFTVAICLSSILLAILVAYACDLDELASARDEAWANYKAADRTVELHRGREPWYPGIGAGTTSVPAVATGMVVIAKGTASVLAAGTGVGTAIGLAAAGAWVGWNIQLAMYESELATARHAYDEAVANYEACANPPQRYTYTDYRGHVYEFSSKEDYNDFLRNRGHSTI